MVYPEFKAEFQRVTGQLFAELDSVYEDSTLSSEEKEARFEAIAEKYEFPLDEVAVSVS